ncbi:MAG TPA: tRNA pseudouridine(55) synthase TruB [Burkholderiales bacterium]|nr:tRNA pseudouridine(55) synthase TruB [Burkholderiales bacterium]
MKRKRNCFDVHGVLLLDKPAGLTSNDALQKTKRLLNACKAGHTGSLDPIATGLLPLCFGAATRLSQFLLDADKRYWTVFRLGVNTTTFDSEGEATRTRPVSCTLREVETALASFTGALRQLPPMYSAIKIGGQPLYKLARAGQEVEREPREVHVYSLRLIELEGDRLTLDIHCSKGTYIRALAEDIGEVLGCGAHVIELRRTGVGGLSVDQAVTVGSLEALAEPAERARNLLPLDAMLSGYPDVHLTALAAHYLRQGQPVSLQHGRQPGWVRLYEGETRFLGLGQIMDDGRVAPRRLLGTGKSP